MAVVPALRLQAFPPAFSLGQRTQGSACLRSVESRLARRGGPGLGGERGKPAPATTRHFPTRLGPRLGRGWDEVDRGRNRSSSRYEYEHFHGLPWFSILEYSVHLKTESKTLPPQSGNSLDRSGRCNLVAAGGGTSRTCWCSTRRSGMAPSANFHLPVVFENLRDPESLHQLLDSLEALDRVAEEVFGRITGRVQQQRSDLQGIQTRLSEAEVGARLPTARADSPAYVLVRPVASP